jgi:hypothetical protein
LPATPETRDYAAHNRYAGTTSAPDKARDNLQNGRWKLPLGTLVVVDDADHLPAEQLHWLAQNAARTNTKLLLLTNPEAGREPAHTLTTVLDTHLPWAAQLGTPEPGWQRPHTAIERAHHHIAGAHTRVGAEYDAAAALLDRRARLLDYFREMADLAAQLDALAARDAGPRPPPRPRPRARTLSGSGEFGERHAHAGRPRRVHDVGALNAARQTARCQHISVSRRRAVMNSFR